MSDLGNILRELRGKRSLREIAKISGISHNYLSIVERGIDPRTGTPVNPTPDTLKKLSEAYQYSYEKLMSKAGYIQMFDQEKFIHEEEIGDKGSDRRSKFTDDVMKDFDRLPPEEQERIHKIIKAFLEVPKDV